MRLSTARDRDEERAVAVIRVALDAGVILLDTADAYCHDEHDVGHNERLVARALAAWSGDRTRVTVATKGGIRRPKGAWVNDARAKHLRDACDASRRALGADTIDLYQLHAVDPKTPLETSVRALATLQREGAIKQIGLCNVTVGQIERAREIAEIASVQVSLSVLDDENLRNGVAEYCRDHGIRVIAYRPLGGDRAAKLARDPVLGSVAAKYGATPHEVALAWLTSFGSGVVPIPGATRIETATSLARVIELTLDEGDRHSLDDRFAGRLLRVPRAIRRPPPAATGDVALVMGMPGAGKSTLARELEAHGYERLNRDTLGGSLADLIPRLDRALASGTRRLVLDNTYATRRSRSEVIEGAWAHGVPVRCVWLATELPDAQINAITRMIDAHGSLPSPEEIRERNKVDPRYLGPDALFRFERTLEAPIEDEGFTTVERRAFRRSPPTLSNPRRSLILDFDDVARSRTGQLALRPDDIMIDASRCERLGRFAGERWIVFAHAWRPQVARGEITMADVDACFAQARALLGVDAEFACCPHDAGPPVCWCRKPLPGTVLELAMRRGVALADSLVVAHSAADRTMAERLGTPCKDAAAFFDGVQETS
jgi:aryl-alcohol dehydrogenase-like predicted oxidoreductase/predicted kinase